MAGILRKVRPVLRPIRHRQEEDEDRNNIEYSIALEYCGPPVTFDVPRVVPVDVSKIPIAATVSSNSLHDVPLPVIQPIVKSKSNPSNQKPKLGINSIGVDTSSALGCQGAGNSGQVGFANGDQCKLKSPIGAGSCEIHDACDDSGESSGSSAVLDLPDDGREDVGGNFQNYMNPRIGESAESGRTSHSSSSEIFSAKDEDRIEEVPCHVKKPSVVTFLDPESSSTVVQEESDICEAGTVTPARQVAVRPGKKGTCYKCMKGNRFTDKEVCIVCGAKYCYSCVLRAMGSMPEGRKCITCIGQRIDEARRKNLGKCSRMLKQLLLETEVERIMSFERSCKVNQLPPELVYVNREHLSQQELLVLQSCPNPPKKLKPGYYWYDKVSGFWGQEGQKPCQIISPQLNIGGHIRKDASDGNTNIIINNREITKSELLMLQWAGVKCEAADHLWVSADGSYTEEGMNNVKGNIWKTGRARLACAVLSLPFPPESANTDEEEVEIPDIKQKSLYKLLLVGYKRSGTSTIFKQAKIVYNVPFSEDERQSIKYVIQSNLYGYVGILLEGRERFEEEALMRKRRKSIGQCSTSAQVDDTTIYSIGQRLKLFCDWLLQVMASGNLETIFPAATREYASLLQDMWKDPAIQATYNRRNELEMLPRIATYFLERAVEIARTDYEPSDMDILYAEGITSSKGLSCMEFSFPKSARDSCEHIGYDHDPSLRYQLIRAHPRILGGNCKWLEMFEDVDMVLFCVSLADYDEFSMDSNGVSTNKMMASKQLFESIVTHSTFEEKKFLLLLNKFDLLEEKIEQVPLTRCEWFQDFNPVIGHSIASRSSSSSRNSNPSLALRAFQYIAMKFKKLFHSLTDRKLYISLVTALEPDNVDEGLRYAREILKWEEEELNCPNNELSSASIEASSSS